MSAEITLIIDGQPVTVPAGTTIMQAARSIGKDIPTVCYHEACTSNGLCRTCMVEVEGVRLLAASCVAEARQDMVVHTRSPRVERARRTVLEMLASAVDLSEAPDIERMIQDYKADIERFPSTVRRDPPVIDDNPMYVRDYAKCVLCWRCVQVCAEDAQYTYAINFSGRGFETQIGTFFDRPMMETTCVFCGQCVGVCPTGALKPKREWLLEQNMTPEQFLNFGAKKDKQRRRK